MIKTHLMPRHGVIHGQQEGQAGVQQDVGVVGVQLFLIHVPGQVAHGQPGSTKILPAHQIGQEMGQLVVGLTLVQVEPGKDGHLKVNITGCVRLITPGHFKD